MDWRARLRTRLAGTRPGAAGEPRLAGLGLEQSRRYAHLVPESPRAAAVLVPLVDHADGLTVLLTERAADLRNHPGQIAFPGGTLEPGESPVDAALRECEEEIGLGRGHVELLGCLPDHYVISGFRVTPLVGLVRAGVPLTLDPVEVAGTFEVPLAHVFDPANRRARTRPMPDGAEAEVFDIAWGARSIWGATAGMLMTLHAVLTDAEPPRTAATGDATR